MGNTHIRPHSRSKNKKQVHWKAADRPSAPGRPHLAADGDLTPGLLTIRWAKPARDGGSPVAGYLVEHRRAGSSHWARTTAAPVPRAEHAVGGLEAGWRYQFRVLAENAVGLSDPSEASEPLTVALQAFALTAPRFTEELADVVALENEKAEFAVHFAGQPPPRICWFKDGFEIFSSRRTRILTDGDRSVLTIHQSALSDEGEIKCTATNKAGHASTRARLALEAPPSIRLPRQYEDGLLFELGEAVRLKVSIAGRPTPLVFWHHNGESIQNNDRYEIEYGDRSSVLKIGAATRADRGEYQIKAVNRLGEHAAAFLVTVTDKPSPPGRARVVMTLGRSVTLTWATPEDDGGCKIGNYIVEYYRLGWNVWLKAATSRQLSTILGDLIEGSEYRFRVKAESPYGVSEPSEESETVFIPDPRRGITTPEIRSRSQPRDFIDEMVIPVASKRKQKPRSQSSTRAENYDTQSIIDKNISSAGVPKRPERMKLRSPNKTPESSPLIARKEASNRMILDRASIARELAYGSPDLKLKKFDSVSSSRNSPISDSPSPAPVMQKSVENVRASEIKSEKVIPTETLRTLENRSPSPSTTVNNIEVLSSGADKRRLMFKDDSANVSGSSEFMLVLYPDENEKSQEKRNYGMLLDLDFDDIPPPLSLSAPELGAEPPNFNNLKSFASSTELLHERAMIRFNEAAIAEETKTAANEKKLKKEFSLDIPKIQINSKDDQEIVGLERKDSFRRRLSGGIVQQQMLWAQRRYSLRNTSDLSDIVENKLQSTKSAMSKRTIELTRQRSNSETEEEGLFEQLRVNMSSNKSQSREQKRNIEIADEDKWLEDYEESLSEEESSSEDERCQNEERQTEMFSDEEDDIYHPGLMPSDRKVSSEPFEILTKKNKLPDPSFVPKPILKKIEQPPFQTVNFSKGKNTQTKTRSRSPMPHSRQRSQSLIPSKQHQPTTNPNTLSKLFKRNRSSSLTPIKAEEVKTEPPISNPVYSISAVAQVSGITAASIVIPNRLLNKKQDEEEARVVVDHYGDILRNYSQKRKSLPNIQTRDNLHQKPASDIPAEFKMGAKGTTQKQDHSKAIKTRSTTVSPPPQKHVVEKRSPSPVLTVNPPPQGRRDSVTTSGSERSDSVLSERRDSLSVEGVRDTFFSSRRSPSPSSRKRRGSEKRLSSKTNRNTSKSPVKTENWRGKETPSGLGGNRSSSPLGNRDVQINTNLLSPVPSAGRRPMLREIMTQTSVGLDRRRRSSVSIRDEIAIKAGMKVRSFVDYLTDLAMFVVACWLYFFSNELLAVPILLIMMYRQLKAEFLRWVPKWILKKILGKPK